MKKLKMIVTSVVVLAIVGSAFAFNAQKKALFCTSVDLNHQTCGTITPGATQKRISGTGNAYYIVDWNGVACNGAACTTSALFTDN
jgi:hypothetical protein